MKLPVHVRFDEARGVAQAYCPDLPGCSASAPDEAAALALLRRRIDAYFADSRKHAPAGTHIVHLEV
jgi:predicted RNase H-like HicB family nuclease